MSDNWRERADDADKKGQNQEQKIKRKGEHRKQRMHYPETDKDNFC